MGSRNTDGTRILKTENLRSLRQEGARLSNGRSSDDTVVTRVENTSFRPPDGAATGGY